MPGFQGLIETIFQPSRFSSLSTLAYRKVLLQ